MTVTTDAAMASHATVDPPDLKGVGKHQPAMDDDDEPPVSRR